MEKFEALPSCKRMAYAGLMHSCATLETGHDINGSPVDDAALSDQMQLYAVRLAVCERSDAGASIPKSCKSFVPTEENTKSKGIFGFFYSRDKRQPIVSYPEYEKATKKNLPTCLADMHKDTQNWNSYSNAGQTVATLCHAVRPEIDKENLLQLHKALTGQLESNFDTLRIINEYGKETALAWQKLVAVSRQNLANFLNDSHEAQARLLKMWSDHEDAMRVKLQDVGQSAEQVESVLQDTTLQARLAYEHVEKLMENALHASNVLDQHRTDLAVASKDVEDHQDKINYVFELFRQQLAQGVNETSIIHSVLLEDLKQISIRNSNANSQIEDVESSLTSLRAGLNATTESMANLSQSMSNITETMASVKDDVQAFSAYSEGLGNAVRFGNFLAEYAVPIGLLFCLRLVIKYCPGASTLLEACWFAFWRTLGSVGARLVRLVGPIILTTIVAVLGATYFGLKTEFASSLIARWQAGGMSPAKAAVLAFFTFIAAVTVIGLGATAFRRFDSQAANKALLPEVAPELEEKKGFWFNNPRNYAHEREQA